MHYKLLPHLWYTISSTADCDVECSNGISIHLPAHFQHFLFADMESIDVSGEATVTQNPPNFTPYSESRGEEWTADLRIGHAAADAVAAVCTLTLGDLGTGGTLADSNGQSVELDAPQAYATGQVDIADATEAGTITFGTHEAIEFAAEPAVAASALFTVREDLPDGIEFALAIDGEEINVFSAENEEGWTLDTIVSAINNADNWTHAPEVEASKADGKCLLTAKSEYPGTAGNSLEVQAWAYTPFTNPSTFLSGGTDARTPQDVVDILNDSENCPAVAVLSHVDAQDAKAVFTPLESYEAGTEYKLSIMENEAEVNSWAWQAQEGDGVQELVAALNDDTGQLWENTNCVEASLEDGKVALRKLDVHGAASNGYSVNLDDNPPFEESEETPIEGGRDESDTVTFTAKEYGVNDTISITGDLFENPQGMSGGHGDYTIAELLEAIGDEFTDITAAEGAAEGTITLTATTAGKAANAITYTATGCFGSGATRQGSTTRGKDAVEQTDFKIFLNGNEFTGGGAPVAPVPEPLGTTTTLKHGGVYTVDAAITATAVTIPSNATAEIWVRFGATSFNVQLPPSWVWVNGEASDMTGKTHTTFCITVRNDGVKTLASIAYSYDTTPSQS